MAKKPTRDKLATGRAIHAAVSKARVNIADATVKRHIRPLRRDFTALKRHVEEMNALTAAIEASLGVRITKLEQTLAVRP